MTLQVAVLFWRQRRAGRGRIRRPAYSRRGLPRGKEGQKVRESWTEGSEVRQFVSKVRHVERKRRRDLHVPLAW